MLYIDKPGGVTHEDCALISERLGKLLDEEDVIPDDGYTLEVSSPEWSASSPSRAISSAWSDRRSGWRFEAVAGPRTSFKANLPIRRRDARAGSRAGQLVRVPLEQVQKANLKFEW